MVKGLSWASKIWVQVIWWDSSQDKYTNCALLRKSPSAGNCDMMASSHALAMVLSRDGRTVNFHIKAQAQPVSRLCCIWLKPLFSPVARSESQGIFVVPTYSLWEPCVSCRNLNTIQRFYFWASKRVCVCVCTCVCTHAQAHVPVCARVFERERKNPCTAWVSSPFPFDHVPGSLP